MNHALIFAGGTGQRMNTRAKPKQFLELHGKPVIVYTIEHFELHPEIDNVAVVCIESWIDYLRHTVKTYDLSKVSTIIPGGETGDESIRFGLEALSKSAAADDIVLIHDGVRPLINAELISENIRTVKAHGNAITVEPALESAVQIRAGKVINVPPRGEMGSAKAPQSFKFGAIFDLYKRSQNDGIHTIDSAHLCSIYGVEMHTVMSTANNIKITAPSDYYIFRALYEAMENEQIIGL